MGATLMVSRQRKDKEHGIACRHVFRTPLGKSGLRRTDRDARNPAKFLAQEWRQASAVRVQSQWCVQPSLPMAQISVPPCATGASMARRLRPPFGDVDLAGRYSADLDLPSGAAGSKNRESGRAEVDSGRGQDHLSVAAIFSGICRNFLIEGPCLTTTIVD